MSQRRTMVDNALKRSEQSRNKKSIRKTRKQPSATQVRGFCEAIQAKPFQQSRAYVIDSL